MQNEALLRQRQVRIGGSTYLVMSDAGAGFDGLDDATSQATTTTSTEPHIESVSSAPGSTICVCSQREEEKKAPDRQGEVAGTGSQPAGASA